jgi:hypothetical protein
VRKKRGLILACVGGWEAAESRRVATDRNIYRASRAGWRSSTLNSVGVDDDVVGAGNVVEHANVSADKVVSLHGDESSSVRRELIGNHVCDFGVANEFAVQAIVWFNAIALVCHKITDVLR